MSEIFAEDLSKGNSMQINERFARLILAQHEVVLSLAALLIEVTQTVIDEFPETESRLLRLINETGTTIQAATLLLIEVPNA